MGFKHRHYLSGNKVYSCNVCRTHLATIESIISRRFNGQHGQAYLFETVFNVAEGEAEERHMTTGLHKVRDLKCAKCGQTMGWKYDRAYEPSQKYKEGKSILEKNLLIESVPPAFENGLDTDKNSQHLAQPLNVDSLNQSSRISMEGSNYSVRSLSTGSAEESD